MKGWLEKDEKLQQQIDLKLLSLPPIFREFYLWAQEKRSNTTVKNYIEYIEDFMIDITNGENHDDFYKAVTSSVIRSHMIQFRVKGDDYRALRWSALNTFFRFLLTNHYITENPMLNTERPSVKTKHEVVFLTPEEIDRLMQVIEKNERGNMLERDKAIIGLALSTGLRVSALTSIDIDDVNFASNIVMVREKGGIVKPIGFGQKTKELLQDWMLVRIKTYGESDTQALFISQWKRRITTNAVRDLVKKYSERAGIEKHITPHKLRSTSATNLAAAGVSIQAISKRLGHRHLETTKRYVDVLDKEMENLISVQDKLI